MNIKDLFIFSKDGKKEKKYIQFSKIVVAMCLINLFVIEFFSMWMIYRFGDTSQISYLITAIAAECLACVVWYMKNSEAEKKARIQAEVDKAKLDAEVRSLDESISGEDLSGDTGFEESDGVG